MDADSNWMTEMLETYGEELNIPEDLGWFDSVLHQTASEMDAEESPERPRAR